MSLGLQREDYGLHSLRIRVLAAAAGTELPTREIGRSMKGLVAVAPAHSNIMSRILILCKAWPGIHRIHWRRFLPVCPLLVK